MCILETLNHLWLSGAYVSSCPFLVCVNIYIQEYILYNNSFVKRFCRILRYLAEYTKIPYFHGAHILLQYTNSKHNKKAKCLIFKKKRKKEHMFFSKDYVLFCICFHSQKLYYFYFIQVASFILDQNFPPLNFTARV